jgi:tetratricopeptide (TPR) repeat protein
MRSLALAIIGVFACAAANAADPGPEARAIKSLLEFYTQGEKDWDNGGSLGSGDGAVAFIELGLASGALERGWLATSHVCRYWAARTLNQTAASDALAILRTGLNESAVADLTAAADRTRRMIESEALAARHPGFTPAERQRLLDRSRARQRQGALEAALCSHLAAARSSAELRRAMVQRLAVDRQAVMEKLESEWKLVARLVEVSFSDEIVGKTTLRLVAPAARAVRTAQAQLIPAALTATAIALGPGSHPMELSKSSPFAEFLGKTRQVDVSARNVFDQARREARGDDLAFFRMYLSPRPLRAAWVDVAGGPSLYAAEIARQLLQDFTESSVRERKFDSPEQVDRQRYAARVLGIAIDAGISGDQTRARLYAAADGPPDDQSVWRGSWADWDWMTEDDRATLEADGRIITLFDGSSWLLPPGKRVRGGKLPDGARAIRLAFDGVALRRGHTLNSEPFPGGTTTAGTLRAPWLAALHADALMHGKRPPATALPLLEYAARFLPDVPMIFENMGLAAEASGRFAEAVAAFGHLSLLEPSTEEPIAVAYARALMVKGEFAAAKAVLERQLAAKPASAIARRWLAPLAFASGSELATAEDLAIAYDGLVMVGNAAAARHANYGALLNYAAALSALHRLGQMRRHDPAWLKTEGSRLLDLVIKHRKAVTLPPALPQRAVTSAREAETLVSKGNLMAAALAYGRALDAAPWWSGGYRNMAMIYGAMGAEEYAIDTMNIALELEPQGAEADKGRKKIVVWRERAAVVRSRGGHYRPDIPFPILPDKE